MIRSAFVIIGVILFTGLFGIPLIICAPFDPTGKLVYHTGRIWAWCILKISGVTLKVSEVSPLNRGSQYIYMCNHASLYDIPAVLLTTPTHFVTIAKKELFYIPIFGWVMKFGKHIPIDRSNLDKARLSFSKAAKALRKSNRSLLIFGEGTRSLDGKLKAFKSGPFYFAMNARLPVPPLRQ